MVSLKTELVILGSGPAGLSASLWANELGVSALVLESAAESGGQLLQTFNKIENHLGSSTNNGVQLRDLFLKQLSTREIDIRCESPAREIDAEDRIVFTADGSKIRYRYVLVCTGVRRRELGIPGEIEFRGKGILGSGKKEGHKASGKTAVVVGGGDAAFENALILARHARNVVLVHRREVFSAREEFISEVKENPAIKVITNARMDAIVGENCVEEVLFSKKSGEKAAIAADVVVIRVGVVPNSSIVGGLVKTDRSGYILVAADGSTSEASIFAAGDVANPISPTISTAVGMGATAVKRIRELLHKP